MLRTRHTGISKGWAELRSTPQANSSAHLAVDADLNAWRRAVAGGASRPHAAEHADGAAQILHLIVQPRVVQHRRPVLRRDVRQLLELCGVEETCKLVCLEPLHTCAGNTQSLTSQCRH